MPRLVAAVRRARTLAAPAVAAAAVTGLLAPVTAAAATSTTPGTAASSTTSTTSAAALAASSSRPRGIDVSRYQSGSTLTTCTGSVQVNWAKVRASGRTFAFVKASGSRPSGTISQDPCFARNWAGARDAGLFRGAYHYAIPSAKAGSAVADARFFVNVTGSLQGVGDLPPVLDLESTGGLSRAKVAAWATTWLTTVRELTGRQPVLYTGPYFWRTYVAGGAAFAGFPLWIANYTTKAAPIVPAPWTRWTFWQSSASGRVPGVSGDVDVDTFNGTAAELRALAHPATEPTATGSATVVYGSQSWTLSGALRSAGTPVPDVTVRLYQRPAGSAAWTAVATARTAARTGEYRFELQPTQAASYVVRYAGGRDFAPSASAVVSHTYSDRMPTALTSRVSSSQVVKRQAVRLTGALTIAPTRTAVRRAPVAVYRKIGTGPWTQVRRLTT